MIALLTIHSINRWIILLIAVVVLVRLIAEATRSRPFAPADLTWLRIYTADLGLQVVLGLIYLVWSGMNGVGFPGYRMEHVVIMLLAVAAGGVAQVQVKRGGRAALPLGAMIVSLVLIVTGVSLLPGGWRR